MIRQPVLHSKSVKNNHSTMSSANFLNGTRFVTNVTIRRYFVLLCTFKQFSRSIFAKFLSLSFNVPIILERQCTDLSEEETEFEFIIYCTIVN